MSYKFPLDDNLAGYWKFDEGSGTIAKDSSSNLNDGSLLGSMTVDDWVPGKSGTCLDLDGIDDTVKILHDSSISPTSVVSLSVWVKFDTVEDVLSSIINKGGQSTNKLFWLYYDRRSTTDRLDFQIGNGSTRDQVIATNLNLSINTWYHIVATYNAATEKAYLYLDGEEVGNNTLTGIGNCDTSTSDLYVGSYTGTSYFLDGKIDEPRLYFSELTAAEDNALYQTPEGGNGVPISTQLIYKVYDEDGTFINVLNDVISDFSITKSINGGDSDFSFVLSRKMDDFSEGTEIDFNHRIKVYLKDEYNTAGTTLIAYGYIIAYQPYLKGKEEGVEVTCLSAISKLSNDFYRTGTSNDASELGIELTDQRVDEMMTAIINHYRSIETNSMIAAPSGLDQTTDNAGNLYEFDLRFFNMKHIDALREASKYLAKYKDGGYWYYWRVNTAGSLILKNISTTADHKFTIGKHITEISGNKTIESVVNRVYFWNEKGTVDPDYLKLTANDTTSQGSYDVMAEYITDSAVTNSSAASLLTESRIYDKKDPAVKIQVTLNKEYDLASIEPGQTCQIFNVENNPFKVGSDEILIIQSVQYEVDSATLELSEPADDFEDIVEEERQRLDKELRWFGYITQQLTAAQLGPANRTWTSDIIFSATSGADAYRKVDWTAGIVYIPTSSNNSAGKRVIVAGTTGLMSAATDYYIYLDEYTINTSAATVVSGTGVIKQGGDVLGDSSKSWTVDAYKGYIATIGGQTRIIKSNTATVLTLEDSWSIADATAAYTIKKMTLDVTTDKTVATKRSSIIFSNARANTNTDSSATITPGGSGNSSNDNFVLDGTENIAYRSITAISIKADSITANEINTAAINIGVWAGSLDNVDDGSTYKKTTQNEKTGAGRAYSGLNSSYRPSVGILTSDLAAITLPGSFTGVRIDTAGVYGYASGSPTFYARTSDGAFWTQGTLQTGSSGVNVYISPTTGLQFRFNTGVFGQMKAYSYSSGYGVGIYTGSGSSVSETYIKVLYDSDFPVTSYIEFGTNDLPIFYMDVGGLYPSGDRIQELGTSANEFADVFTASITLNGVNRTSWPSSGVSAHGDLSGVTADQHHNRSHDHSSSSDDNSIAPYTCWATSTGSGTNSAIKGSRICTTSGQVYYNSLLMLDFYSDRISMIYPLKLPTYSGPPGDYDDFIGCMYYDDNESDIVFATNTGWYKITAEGI